MAKEKRSKMISAFSRKVIFLFLSAVFFSANAAFAHVPHDDIYQLEISRTYSQDKTLFIIARKNLFKSEDGGKNWIRLVNGLDNRSQLYSLAISSQTKEILYVSTLADSSPLSPLYRGDGIYKSVDAGASWQKVNNGLKTLSIDLIAVSPYSDDIVFAAGEKGGLYKTEDGAKTWHQVIPDDNKITAIGFFSEKKNQIAMGDDKGTLYILNNENNAYKEISTLKNAGAITKIAIPENFSISKAFYVGTEKKGVFKTIDAGISFNAVNKGLSGEYIMDMVIVPTGDKKSIIYVSTWHEGVFCSKDEAKTWQKCSKGLKKDHQADHPELLRGEIGIFSVRPHFSNIRTSDNFNDDKVIFLAGFTGLYKSKNGGKSWKELDTLSNTIIGISISPNYKNDFNVVAAGYTGEVYVSTDAGDDWEFISRYLKYAMQEEQHFTKGPKETHLLVKRPRFFDVVFSPTYASDKTIYFSTLWQKPQSLLRFKEGKWLETFITNQGAIAFSPNFAKDKTMYQASEKASFRVSKDKGETFTRAAATQLSWRHGSLSFVISPNFSSDKTLYYTHYRHKGGLLRSQDAGYTWQNIAKDTPLAQRLNIGLAISSNYNNDQTLIAGTDEGVYMTQDAGKSWIKVGGSTPVGEEFIEAVAISPNYKNDKTLLVSVKGRGLFKSEDAGLTFSHIGDDSISLSRLNTPSASMPIQFSPNYAQDQTIYGYGAAGNQIFKSTDKGETWQILTIPKPKDTIFDFITDKILILKILAWEYRISKRSLAMVTFVIVFCFFVFWVLNRSKNKWKTIKKL